MNCEDKTAVIAALYRDILIRLLRAIQYKIRCKLTSGMVLIHESAPPYNSHLNEWFLDLFQWNIFQNPPYNPDLEMSD